MLAAYCRLPRFLKGDEGLLLAPDVVPVDMLVENVARTGLLRVGWWRAERAFAGWNVRGTERTRRSERGEEKDAAQMWELQGGCCSQLACMRVFLRARYAPMSRDFQASVELESIPLQRKKAPPTLVPELQRGWGRRVHARSVLLLPWQPHRAVTDGEQSCAAGLIISKVTSCFGQHSPAGGNVKVSSSSGCIKCAR